jgi:hypothetical protein
MRHVYEDLQPKELAGLNGAFPSTFFEMLCSVALDIQWVYRSSLE